jgi:hypothetical protein
MVPVGKFKMGSSEEVIFELGIGEGGKLTLKWLGGLKKPVSWSPTQLPFWMSSSFLNILYYLNGVHIPLLYALEV